LGCCDCATEAAKQIKAYLRKVGATVLDWKDFSPSGMILTRIEEAAAVCSSGIFLFTKDDPVESEPNVMAPRDNIIFETGFFFHAKEQRRVLIVHQNGAEMPDDLGGNIHAPIEDFSDIEFIKERISNFLEEALHISKSSVQVDANLEPVWDAG
jgi:predicted nucleotide-binding protein